jgi:hypothetical protein
MPLASQTAGPRIIVHAPTSRAAERRYIIDLVLRQWLGLAFAIEPTEQSVWWLSLEGDPSRRRIVLPDILLGVSEADWLTTKCLPRRPLAQVDLAFGATRRRGAAGLKLPVLFGTVVDGLVWTETPQGIDLAVDVFGSSFFLLSRMEELIVLERDHHDRFPAERSLLVSEGFVLRPLVDEYVDVLADAITALWPRVTRKSSTFRLRLTHDVDRPWTMLPGMRPLVAMRSLAGDVVRRRDWSLALRRLLGVADARHGRFDRDPLATFDFLMATSEHQGLRSTFYFLAGPLPGEYDYRYDITDPFFRPIFRAIRDRGHEIGLHGSYLIYRSADRIRGELAALVQACGAAGVRQDAWGVRQHYLRFTAPETWRHHEAAGLAHDSTMGFAERIGFRSGTCREHQVFDLVERRELALMERPLVVMDATMFGYMGLTPEGAIDHAREAVATCRTHGGDAVILYHNDSVAGSRARAHYIDLVGELARPR